MSKCPHLLAVEIRHRKTELYQIVRVDQFTTPSLKHNMTKPHYYGRLLCLLEKRVLLNIYTYLAVKSRAWNRETKLAKRVMVGKPNPRLNTPKAHLQLAIHRCWILKNGTL